MESLFDIDGFEKYKATKTGKIFSVSSKIFLKPQIRGNKYYVVSLYKRNRNRLPIIKPVHRLICSAIHPNKDGKPFVNHKDGNKLNNHFKNLEWCTRLENVEHAKALNLYANCGHGRKRGREVVDTETGYVYRSIAEAARKNNLKAGNLINWLSGYHKNKSTLKFHNHEQQKEKKQKR